MEELYRTLGDAKCRELFRKETTLWNVLRHSEGRKSGQVYGGVLEGIAKDFIREFLPARLGIKSGLVFDAENKMTSPQTDGIIYSGAPLLEFTDAVVVEKEQVKAIIEVKSWIGTTKIFGERSGGSRDLNSGLASDFQRRQCFLPSGARYILFAFELGTTSLSDIKVIGRLKKVCHSYAIISQPTPKSEQKKGEEPYIYNFDNSVSRLIEWLRNLS